MQSLPTSLSECPGDLLEHLVTTDAAAKLLGYASSRCLYEQLRRDICPVTPWKFFVGNRTHLRWDRRELLSLLER